MDFELASKAAALAFEHVKRGTPFAAAAKAVAALSLADLPPSVADRFNRIDLDAALGEIRSQVVALFGSDPPDDEITGLWFGMLEAAEPDAADTRIVLYVSGNSAFDPSDVDPDWPCEPEWFPADRFESSLLSGLSERPVDDDARWLVECGLIEPLVILVVGTLARTISPAVLLGSAPLRGIATGYDEGDVNMLGVVTPAGFTPSESLAIDEPDDSEDEEEGGDDDLDAADDDDSDGDESEDGEDDEEEEWTTTDRPSLSAACRVPRRGAINPGRTANVTTPGSFANAPDLGGPLMFSSPDTPGMPPPSERTAWDFLPAGWSVSRLERASTPEAFDWMGRVASGNPHVPGVEAAPANDGPRGTSACSCCKNEAHKRVEFITARGERLRVSYPREFLPATQLEFARLGIVTPQMRRVADREPHFDVMTGGQGALAVRDEVAAGRMVIPANVHHLSRKLDPMAIGRASRTKVNANMGASPVSSGTGEEVEKLKWAERWGADTVMDLSTGGDLDACRAAILAESTVPIGTVPIYSMIIGRRIEDLDWPVIERSLRHQAAQGVDYFTIHAGVRRAHLKYVRDRLIGIVSRGGSLLAKWMLVHNKENIMYERWEDICDILRESDVTFSIGDGLRPGGLADATDDAQLAELETLGELTERAWRRGVQVMIEGPGHVPFDQIEWNAKVQRAVCHGAPFYVLGPLVTDMFPGYDHITSCIGATAMAYHGAAMLCYVTPKEHLGLPKKDDVKQGCIAYRIAAHAADVALGIPGTRDRDDDLTKARAALNWEKHFELSFDPDTARAYHDEDLDVDTDFCAMCGHDWCSVRISKEIQEFASGKAGAFQRLGGKDGTTVGAPRISDALTPEQQEILAKRGVLSPEEVHRLASKTRRTVGADKGKATCHSDYAGPEAAQQLQRANGGELVQVDVRPAMGIGKEDRVV